MRLWPRSLTRRILLIEILSIVVLIAALPPLTIAMLHDTINSHQHRLLAGEAAAIAAGLKVDGAGAHVELPATMKAVYDGAFDGRAYAVVDRAGRVLDRSPGSRDLPLRRVPRGRGRRQFHLSPFIGLSERVATPAGPLWVVVSQDETEPGAIIDDIARSFLWRYIAALTAVLLVLPLVNALVIRQLVRAVQRVSERAAEIGPDTPGLRLEEANLPTEVTELVRATNRQIDRLQQALVQQRSFIANIVHELKTPLATLRIHLDRLDDAQAREALDQQVDRLSHVLSQMRDLAELETLDDAARLPFDLGNLARRTVALLAPQVFQAGDRIELSLPDASVGVRGSRTLVELALRNLIDNATQHTPPGTTIVVEVRPGGVLSVSDDGPGIASEAPSQVTTRFWRADRTRADTAGLGLSIVERICEVHGGRLDIRSAPGAGAVFTMTLPTAE